MATGKASAKSAKDKKAGSAQNVMTPEGIVSFSNVWTPKAFENNEANYSLILVFPKGTDLTDLKAAIKAAAIAKFGPDYKERKLKLKNPIRPAEEYAEYGVPFDDEKGGRFFVNLKSRSQPGIVDRRTQPIINRDDFYSGCIARATVYAHPFDTKGNKGVTLLLNNIQKTADGERIGGGRRAAEDDFERIEGDDDDNTFDDDDIL